MRESCDYKTSFFQDANPYDYCFETFALPRVKHYHKRVTPNGEFPAKNLFTHSTKRFQYSETHKYKKWLLTTYALDAVVDWIRFDIDRHHYEDIYTPDEYKRAEAEFYKQVQQLDEIADEQGFDILWTTSPGDIIQGGICDGQHIQGLYAWIFLDRPIPVMQLFPWTKALKEYHHIESECSWDKDSQLIRLPGQRHVELCNPYNMQPKYVYDDSKPAAGFDQFNDAMQNIEPAIDPCISKETEALR